ncbi:hypothetical protein ACHAQA_003360 [Verticillium albo-atrum]
MVSKMFAVALAASTFASAQTFTDCDPTKKDCKPAPALGKSVDVDFTKSNGEDYLYTLDGTKVTYDEEKGAIFSIKKPTEAPTKASHQYIFFGELECTVQAANMQGIVTSIVLQSADLDEIDWEWVGGDNANVQTNYFSKGDTTTYDRGGKHAVENPLGQFHKYGIVWNQEKIDWTIDGVVIRTLNAKDADNGKKFPQTPMQIKLGTWPAGNKDTPKGTVEWAGGYSDYDQAPFIGYYKDCKIVDYAGGNDASSGTANAKEYEYTDRSGSWQSIKVVTGDGSDDDEKDETTTTAPATKTAEATKTTATEASETETETDAEETTTVASTLSSVVVSSTEASESAAATEDSSATASGAEAESAAATSDVSTVPTDEPAAGMMNRANLAMGAVGLFFAFML